jgi:hypothetical protein
VHPNLPETLLFYDRPARQRSPGKQMVLSGQKRCSTRAIVSLVHGGHCYEIADTAD